MTELVEEHSERCLVATGPGPHEPARVVIDHDDQIPVPALVGDLVDPDPTQSIETIDRRVDIRVDARHDRPDRAPRDT